MGKQISLSESPTVFLLDLDPGVLTRFRGLVRSQGSYCKIKKSLIFETKNLDFSARGCIAKGGVLS